VASEDVSLGYDVRSYETDGEKKYIEVKSTSGTAREFEMSAHEWNVAARRRDRYYIARVTKVRDKPTVLEIRDPAASLQAGEITREAAGWRVSY
jgi:hypothetical protein